jgi:hypothetical protein
MGLDQLAQIIEDDAGATALSDQLALLRTAEAVLAELLAAAEQGAELDSAELQQRAAQSEGSAALASLLADRGWSKRWQPMAVWLRQLRDAEPDDPEVVEVARAVAELLPAWYLPTRPRPRPGSSSSSDGASAPPRFAVCTSHGRWSTNRRPRRASDARLVHGFVDVAEHFRMRWREVTGESLPAPAASEQAGDVELQIVRTVPERIYRAQWNGDFRILESYLRALRSARRLIEEYWKPISQEQAARRRAAQPLTHRLVRLEHMSKSSKRLLGPLKGLLVDG